MSNRREFVMQLGLGAGAFVASTAFAAAPALVAETDPAAANLGYKADGSKVDKTKFPKFVAGQNCGNCSLYQAKASDAAGNCPLFAGKQVAKKAWCSAYVKKA
jgi:hypothetical protein